MQKMSRKTLSKVIPHLKNLVICKGACRVCGDWWTDLSNKNVGVQNTKITQQSNEEEKEMEMRETSMYPNPWWETSQWGKSVESLKKNVQILNQGLRCAQYHFQNNLWNENEILEYLRTSAY